MRRYTAVTLLSLVKRIAEGNEDKSHSNNTEGNQRPLFFFLLSQYSICYKIEESVSFVVAAFPTFVQSACGTSLGPRHSGGAGASNLPCRFLHSDCLHTRRTGPSSPRRSSQSCLRSGRRIRHISTGTF